MKKKGFTLVELLAVIVILAIILAIAVPTVTNILNSSARSTFESNAKLVIKTINYKLIENESYNIENLNQSNVESELKIPNDNYESLNVSYAGDKLYVVIVGKNKWDGLKVCGTAQDIKVVDVDDRTTCQEEVSNYNPIRGVNRPILATGMTPIKWNGTTWVDTVETDNSWYEYGTTTGTRNWANAKTADGSIWVWIPRYIYKISNGWHSNLAGTIEIQFSIGTDDTRGGKVVLENDTTANASNNKWTNHPAFTFGDKQLTGIWIAKFEASPDNTSTCYGNSTNTNCNKVGIAPRILPNALSWHNIGVAAAYTNTRNMMIDNTYGWGTSGIGIDTHLIKNTEWGAAAYLSKSVYGQENSEVILNNNNTFITGCGASSNSATAVSTCNAYNTNNGVLASTTGNIYGIYDMSGGMREFVAAYYNSSSASTYGASIYNEANLKYKDLYTTYGDQTKGDAIYETSNNASGSASWYEDMSVFPSSSTTWFTRGELYSSAASSGLYAFNRENGTYTTNTGFRPTLVVYQGPQVIFTPSGNNSYGKRYTTTVSVFSSTSKIDITSLKYLWTTSTAQPDESLITNSFNNNTDISTPENVSGEYYLWVFAKDVNRDKIIIRSEAFKLDNQAPVITINGDTHQDIYLSQTTYTDPGATATDNILGNVTTRIIPTSTLALGIPGDYEITYSVSDDAGNTATATRSITVLPAYIFQYTGNYQTASLAPGTYTFELWGAKGGDYIYSTRNYPGGNGGYSKGAITFDTATTLYIYVGGAGKGGTCTAYQGGWNGGGTAAGSSCPGPGYSGGGGGATDIRLVSGTWNNATSLASRIIVAGGGSGGGSSYYSNIFYAGAAGGGVIGDNGQGKDSVGKTFSATGGTQSTGNALGAGCSTNYFGCSGAGGGYYGGTCLVSGYGSSGAGSGFVPGHPGVASQSNGYTFTDTVMTSGVNAGDGKVIITMVR